MKHLLVTNDFPPKVGGIQSYLWELWRRLPPDSFAVLTIAHPGDAAFDAAQPFRIERVPVPMLLPTPGLAHRVRALAAELGAGLVVLDPALPVGLLGPGLGPLVPGLGRPSPGLGPLRAGLGLPYAVVLHGAEVSVPAHLPGARYGLARVLRGAELAIAGSEWAKGEARRAAGTATPGLVEITPGVDHARFRPAGRAERAATRRRLGLPGEGRLVLSVGRLVPRKGMTTLVEAAARLAHSYPDLTVAIVGSGREEARLARLVATTRAPVRLLGHLPDSDLPPLYGAADVFAQPCRARWAGMEQEGFGIVFLEAAACGVPQVAGRSGGAAEAVVHGRTGLVVDHPGDPAAVAAALGRLLDDEAHRAALGRAARARVEACFTYDHLAARLAHALDAATPGRRSRW